MSIAQSARVWSLPADVPADQRFVLLALAWFADDAGDRVFPSLATLAAMTGKDRRNIRRILRRLEVDGLIVAVAYPQGGRGRSTHYRLLLPENADVSTPVTEGNADVSTPVSLVKGGDTTPVSLTERGAFHTERGVEDGKRGAFQPPDPLDPSYIDPSLDPPVVASRSRATADPDGVAVMNAWRARTGGRLNAHQLAEILDVYGRFCERGDPTGFYAVMDEAALGGATGRAWSPRGFVAAARDRLDGKAPRAFPNRGAGRPDHRAIVYDDDQADADNERQFQIMREQLGRAAGS